MWETMGTPGALGKELGGQTLASCGFVTVKGESSLMINQR